METIVQNNISFSTVKTAGVNLGTWPLILSGQQGPDEDGGVINAVDIDWNNAKLGEAVTTLSQNIQEGLAVNYIKTTGDLLKVIAQLQAQVNSVTTLTKSIYESLTNYTFTLTGDYTNEEDISVNEEISTDNPISVKANDSIKIISKNGSYAYPYVDITYSGLTTLSWERGSNDDYSDSYWYFNMPHNDVSINIEERRKYAIHNDIYDGIISTNNLPSSEVAFRDERYDSYINLYSLDSSNINNLSYQLFIESYTDSSNKTELLWNNDQSYWYFTMPPYEIKLTSVETSISM